MGYIEHADSSIIFVVLFIFFFLFLLSRNDTDSSVARFDVELENVREWFSIWLHRCVVLFFEPFACYFFSPLLFIPSAQKTAFSIKKKGKKKKRDAVKHWLKREEVGRAVYDNVYDTRKYANSLRLTRINAPKIRDVCNWPPLVFPRRLTLFANAPKYSTICPKLVEKREIEKRKPISRRKSCAYIEMTSIQFI